MDEEARRSGIRARGEEAVNDLAQALLDNPLLSATISRALGAGERAAQAQRTAFSALNVATGDDVERLERRLRALSARLEELEDRIDELAAEARRPPSG